MANTNTDLTEEDAADLQFPKGEQSSSEKTLATEILKNDVIIRFCSNCFKELISRYVLCEICKLNICLQCFSKGAEFGCHRNNHSYRLFTTNIILFENSDWTAEEELKLLDSLINYGNWGLVALELPNRTISDIKEHYNYFYLDRNSHKDMPKFEKEIDNRLPEVTVPYRFRLTDSDDPPRYASNTVGYQSLAGYNPARGDFEYEYDKNAEDLLSNIESISVDDPYYKILTDMQCSIVQSYNRRLKERHRWKKIIQDHGLLVLRKTSSWLHRYDLSITKPVYEKLIRFMRFYEPTKFEMLLEGLHRVGELKLQIHRLIQLRKKGMTTLAEGRLYLKLQQIHYENKKKLKLFRSDANFNWRATQVPSLPLRNKFVNKRRSTAIPLEIVGMPGYEKLTEDERELCANIRLVPVSYLELKEVLVAENNRMGHVKLQTARRMLKIDVNKTRKLYDFLVKQGYVGKPNS
ncbi:transcriptional adapter 2-alpha-like isoform X1 [Cylas formicarius]|uniref:transcriptional adapter 2-alpha-like isoform X1 n=1 Tax=Cylas formicarius TaxID=197179 RepID=UPI002958BA14|nr:transcriptional adapter 2-alpha-like isoform X1 [Cylas formicarius]